MCRRVIASRRIAFLNINFSRHHITNVQTSLLDFDLMYDQTLRRRIIFAGINRCDWIATGVVQATRDQEIGVPVIVRLAGTNVEEGRAILDESGLELIQAVDLDDAAAKAVLAAEGVPA